MENDKKNIRELTIEKLKEFFIEKNEKPFRAKQVYEWLWKKNIGSFDEMVNIPRDLRQMMEQYFFVSSPEVKETQESRDKTIKYSFSLHDGNVIESVLIPSGKRMTVCISSQAGCPLNCGFCATGKYGFKRDLAFDEIYGQAAFINKQAKEKFGSHLSNIVIMGMGEPLLNYDNVIHAVNMIISQDGMAMSPHRITLSTVGIPDKIKQLADDNVKFNLAVSLHTANKDKRDLIVPANKKYSLRDIAGSLEYYYSKTNNRITYEYILFRDFNDSISDAKELAEFCKISPCKINIIEYNNIAGMDFHKADEDKQKAFASFLENRNLIVNIRKNRGGDINAACGQLANKSDVS